MGNNADTILHLFKTDSATVFTDFSNFRQNYQIDFVDTLTYEAEFFVTTVCGLPSRVMAALILKSAEEMVVTSKL